MKILFALLCAIGLLVGCSNSSSGDRGGSTSTTTTKSYTCSMCGGSFDRSGDCPKCGMALVEKK